LCYNSPIASPKVGSPKGPLNSNKFQFVETSENNITKTNVFYNRTQLKGHVDDKK
jgi:hypothetical protein